jgi:peptidoglycan/xylan/chitin deacetylase (PgdA/CDA1 family)
MGASTVDILLYHDVCDSKESAESRSNPNYTTPVEKLRYHLDRLAPNDLYAVRLGEWMDARKDGQVWRNRCVVMTLDGPHGGWFEHAIPLLIDLEVPATFFVTAGWVGSHHPYPESRGITWSDIREIERFEDRNGRQLFDVGSHSMWHTTLDAQPSESESKHRKRLQEEVVTASALIREKTGFAVKTYAPPKGKGNLDHLQPVFESAELEAVRWASLPGKTNQFHADLFDLQISYCDTMKKPPDQMISTLSGRLDNPLSRLRNKIAAQLNRQR